MIITEFPVRGGNFTREEFLKEGFRFLGEPVADLFAYAESEIAPDAGIKFVRTNAGTKNTPYSAKLTGNDMGFAIITGYDKYMTILFFVVADYNLFIATKKPEKWYGWYKVTPTLVNGITPAADEPGSNSEAAEAGKEQ